MSMKIVSFLLFLIVLAWIAGIGIDRQFAVSCSTWRQHEKEYPLFELSASLVEECARIKEAVK